MGLIAAIVGLAVLVMIHEAGHFFAARAVGMTPRKFYIGFGPAIVKNDPWRGRVRRRLDPTRRLREDPRHEPPVAGRLRADASAGSGTGACRGDP